ncbi:MAG: Ribonuclease P protein component 1 [Methanomassiliicoccales archaeon PtaU1.Bin124]|nr:MAG: Ribonuclease P protein component 1 [Methanomassiliicoccales archaeon PtaU1.Bin124]
MKEMERRDFMRQEFIGLDVEVVSSGHPGYLTKGVVVDETKNTFTVRSEGKERVVPKPGNEFQFTCESKKIRIKGSEIQHRPEDRVKKIR